jgi:hypothetical protein
MLLGFDPIKIRNETPVGQLSLKPKTFVLKPSHGDHFK